METQPAGGSGVSLLEANRKLREVLLRRGYQISYEEVPGAVHDYLQWRSWFADGLSYLTGQER